LASLSVFGCSQLDVEEIVASRLVSAEPANSDVTANALSFTGRRFRRPSFIEAPTTEQLGELDAPVSVDDSNSFFDRVDRYEFEVTEDGQFEADLEFDRNTYSRIAIYDQSRRRVAISSIRGDSQTSLTAELESGSYVAIVFGGYGRYTLSLDFAADVDVPVDETTAPETVLPERTVDEEPAPNSPTQTPAPNPTPQTELPAADWYGGNLDWNLNSVNAPEAWQAGYRGEDVVVAVIDTGVNISHSDLDDNVWVNADEIAGDGIDNDGNGFIDDRYGWNFVGNNSNVADDNGHGTHVAGSIAAEQNGVGATGVAPDAEVMSIKVLNSDGSGFVNSIARGIRYAVDNGAHIINLSLGGGYSTAIASAIGYAADNDVFVVAAAGNESANVPGNPASLSRSYENVLSVGAYDSNGRIAGFSNGVGNSGAVQVDAPGVSVYSTAANGRYTWLSGTSMAAPHVAGVAALTLSANSNLTAASLRNIIVQSSDRSASGSDATGVVNASLAIPQAINGSASSNTVVRSANIASTATGFTTRGRALAVANASFSVADLPELSKEATSSDVRILSKRITMTAESASNEFDLRSELSSFDASATDELISNYGDWLS